MHNHRIDFGQRTEFRTVLNNIDAAETIKSIPIPIDDQEPIKGLTIHKGYNCNDCDKMKTISLRIIRQHRHDEHREVGNQVNWSTVLLQRWCRVENSKYWVVKVKETQSEEVQSNLVESWNERMKKIEEERLNQVMRKELEVTERSNADDTTPWLMFMKWPEMFKGKDIYNIGRLKYETLDKDLEERFKRWTGRRVELLSRSVEIIVSRSKETLAGTPSSIRMWLRSVERMKPDRRPFKLVQKTITEVQYVRYWKQFLFYCFRVTEVSVKQRKRLYGIEFTEVQLRLMKQVNDILDEMLKEEEDNVTMTKVRSFDSDSEEEEELLLNKDSDDESESEEEEEEEEITEWLGWRQGVGILEKQLSEKVFELCISFSMQIFKGLEENKSPWIHFCGVLAIDWRKKRFREPKNYTCIVAGILWVTRLFFLEYALPKYGYEHLNWPSRDVYEDFGWRMEEVRRKYLLKGCLSPVGSMINMLAYGKTMVRRMGGEAVITWDFDGAGLMIKNKNKDVRVTMEGFKSFVKEVVSELKMDLKELLFGFNMLKLDMENMYDVMSESEKGIEM